MQVIESRKAQFIKIAGKDLIIFSSNDYLGLSHHPEVLKAATEAAEAFGCGTGGAPNTSGTTSLHIKLAGEIAEFKHRQKAVIFPSGYAANVALHHCLGGPNTVFFSDEKNHPSAVDGIKISGTPVKTFVHLDFNHLEKLIKDDKHSKKIVTICSVFTLDGDICPLDELTRLKEKYNFILILDEAHATGCIGDTGRGLEQMFSLEGVADFIMGTFSKALGSQGGFLTYSNEVEKIVSKPLRPYLYSTSISPMAVAASLKALLILKEKPELVEQMRTNIKKIYDYLDEKGFTLNNRGTHIVNVYFDSQKMTLQVVDYLRQNGFFVIPISIYNRWGLRLTTMAVHTEKQINDFCECLMEARKVLTTNRSF